VYKRQKEILHGTHFRVFEADGITVYTWKQEILHPGEEVFCDRAPEMEKVRRWHYPEPEAELPHVPLDVSPILENMEARINQTLEYVAEEVTKEDVVEEEDYTIPEPTISTRHTTVNESSSQTEHKSLDTILFDAGVVSEEDELEDISQEETDNADIFEKVTKRYKSSARPSSHSTGKTKAERRAYLEATAKDAEGPKLSRDVLTERLKANRDKQRAARVEEIKAQKEVVVESEARKHKIAILEARLKVMEDKVESFQRAPEQSQSTDTPKEEKVQEFNSVGQTTRVQETKVNFSPKNQLGLDAIKLIQSMDMQTIIAIKKLEEVDIIGNASLIVSILTLGQEQKLSLIHI
jgi:hypothetical protein